MTKKIKILVTVKIVTLACLFMCTLNVSAKIKRFVGPHDWGHATLYVGTNENVMIYDQGVTEVVVDDGLFVAIPQKDGTHKYYELQYPRICARDGGPAHLPKDPSVFIGDQVSLVASAAAGVKYPSSIVSGIKSLPDGTVLPIGCKFFFWVSGRGNYNLGEIALK